MSVRFRQKDNYDRQIIVTDKIKPGLYSYTIPDGSTFNPKVNLDTISAPALNEYWEVV